nr:hypothetical protein [Cellvibrionaceae bacterium]
SIAIAKRCKLSRSAIQGDFLLFNGSVYTNRISKRCQNIDLISYSNRQNISPELDNKENKKIENFIRKIKLHLTSLITTKVEIGDFDIIFRQRSTTAATLSFLNFICNQSSNICHTADVTLLRKLQLCYWNGVIWEHLIGLSCIALVQKPSSTNNQKRLEFLLSGLDQKELLNLDDKDDYFVDWKNEINIAIRQQRFQLLANFRQELSSYKYKKTLIVLYDHSRTVRTLIKKCLSEPDFADFEIFILVGEDQGINFGSKLIDHQLKNEQYEMESDDLALLRRIRRGKLQNLENIMAQFDNVIYVLSAEEWKQTLNPYLKFCKTTIINEYDNKIKFLLVSLNHKRNLFWMIKDLKHNKKLQCIAPGLRNRLEHAVKIYRREPHSLNHWKHTKVLLPDPL